MLAVFKEQFLSLNRSRWVDSNFVAIWNQFFEIWQRIFKQFAFQFSFFIAQFPNATSKLTSKFQVQTESLIESGEVRLRYGYSFMRTHPTLTYLEFSSKLVLWDHWKANIWNFISFNNYYLNDCIDVIDGWWSLCWWQVGNVMKLTSILSSKLLLSRPFRNLVWTQADSRR